jgi:glycine/D-amino acid oxidase-like deaminating enzyme
MQVLVIGAGIVGLAVARDAARAGHDVIVAEAEPHVGSGTSSRNSEVIHAGLYYPTGSLRARHCARSRRMLYDFCASHGVPHKKLGKLVVVSRDADIAGLEKIFAQATRNGVEGLRMLDGAEAIRMEPALACVAAFHSPETGIIDSHRYMLALQGDLEDAGGVLALNTPVERLTLTPSGWEVRVRRQRAGIAHRRRGGEFGRPWRPEARAGHGRLCGRPGAAARARQGQLFFLQRARRVQPARLSGAGAGRARHPCHARSRRPHAVRPRCAVDRRL